LAPEDRRGRGGRNQQLILAALDHLESAGVHTNAVLLSGGTDGEDGPTDAAGAIIDERLMKAAQIERAEIADALARNDAYTFFGPRNGLIKTGPTHTNVCDVRVVVVSRA
jgi:glycerate-2-kinase